jgi:hypothetical protein
VDADKWATMDTDRRRAAAERVLDTIYVHRAKKRGNTFDPKRLDRCGSSRAVSDVPVPHQLARSSITAHLHNSAPLRGRRRYFEGAN